MGDVTAKDVTSPQLEVAVKVALPEDTVTVFPLTVPLLLVTVPLLLKVTEYPVPVPEHVMFCTVNDGFVHVILTLTVAEEQTVGVALSQIV